MKTPYDVLGVPSDADDKTIRAAFRKAAKAYHPDLNAGDRAAEQHFKRIIAAHAVLKNPERRATYDHHLRLRQQQARREWRVTIAGCMVSAIMSAGLVCGGVLALRNALMPQRSVVMAEAAIPAPSFEDRFAAGIDDGSTGRASSTSAENRRGNDHNPPLGTTLARDDRQPQSNRFGGGLDHRLLRPERPLSTRALAFGSVASGINDPQAVEAFAARSHEGPDARLVRSKLERLIDTTDDIVTLRSLRSAMTGPLAERAQQRINRLTQIAIENALPSLIVRGEEGPATDATPKGHTGREQAALGRAALAETSRAESSGQDRDRTPPRARTVKPDPNTPHTRVQMAAVGSTVSEAFKKAENIGDGLAYDWVVDSGSPTPSPSVPIASGSVETQGRDSIRTPAATDLGGAPKDHAVSRDAAAKHRDRRALTEDRRQSREHARCSGHSPLKMRDGYAQGLWSTCMIAAVRHVARHHREKDRRSAAGRAKFRQG